MIPLSTLLQHYKRKNIQDAIVQHAENKEIAIKFGDSGFGKRPDVLQYGRDVITFAQQGATSFHASEELWRNPLQLDPNLSRKDLDELRSGWDLMIDIDCPFLEYSKVAADLLVKALHAHDISSVSVKFSGNHGFHIAVPFEAFPERLHGQETRLLFPESPRKVAAYLQHMIKEKLAKAILRLDDINTLVKKTGKPFSEIVDAGTLNPFALLVIDTILISSRHLYRMPYCFNEKSGLVSIPIHPRDILTFDKAQAKPEVVQVNEHLFLDRSSARQNEAKSLLIEAFDFTTKVEAEEEKQQRWKRRDEETDLQAIPKEFFPPCMQLGLKGLQDGKKRFLFAAVNFFTSVGWSYEDIEKVLDEWNKKNPEPMREVLIKGQLRYHKQMQKKMLPPNCLNKMYYVDMGICKPDTLCAKIKNPVSYAKRKVFYLQQEQKKGKRGRKKPVTEPVPGIIGSKSDASAIAPSPRQAIEGLPEEQAEE